MVDLPTPPLPEDTAMMFFTPGSSGTPRCTEWLVISLTTSMLSLRSPASGASRSRNSSAMAAKRLLAG
ncbi:hypothetical protein D3C78_1794500 [compost metagenome]